MKHLAILSLALLAAAPLGGCGDRLPVQASPAATARPVASPPAETAPAAPGDDELQAARVLLRHEKARVDGSMPPASWPEADAVRRIGPGAWAVDLDASRLPGGYPEQLVVEVSAAGGHTGRSKR